MAESTENLKPQEHEYGMRWAKCGVCGIRSPRVTQPHPMSKSGLICVDREECFRWMRIIALLGVEPS